MREYETTFIVQPEITDDVRDAFLAKLDGELEAKGGVRLMLDDWGKRKLAYEIENFQKGHYYSLKYLDQGTVVSELERVLKLEESILRYLTVRVAENVADIEARKTEAADEERQLHDRLEAERAAREEEEKSRREAEARAAAEAAEAAAAAAVTAAAAAAAAEAEAAAAAEAGEATDEAEPAAAEAAPEAAAEAAPEAPAEEAAAAPEAEAPAADADSDGDDGKES
ncbi:MAG: 30S ribosomal protein S6 [Deltaproteobacteria bacterium]|nr:30S ribosomal protein S6 [Deltaproteobacteria bacterium]